jgi:hypothetical protein
MLVEKGMGMLPSEQPQDPALLSDSDLTAAVTALARTARETTASLIRHLVEFESRRLHLAAGFDSLFIYCVQVLHLSEHEAYNRIEAARVAGKHPIILDMLARGDLNLTSVRLLGPHLTDANHLALLRDAAGKSKREVLAVIARHFPRPDVPDSVRKVPSRDGAPVLSVAPLARIAGAPSMAAYGHRGEALEAPSGLGSAAVGGAAVAGQDVQASCPVRRESMQPRAPDRYEIRFTASAETCEKLRLAKDLLRHVNAAGDTADIVDRALTLLLADLARKKFGATPRPRATRHEGRGERNIPAAVRRAVWLRDLGRCAFVGKGRRCEARGFLEFHHVRPYGVGGEATIENIEVRCRAHNRYEADLFYGRLVPARVEGGAGSGADGGDNPGVLERTKTGWTAVTAQPVAWDLLGQSRRFVEFGDRLGQP